MNCSRCGKEMEAGFLQTDVRSPICYVSKLLPLGLGSWKKDAQDVSQLTAAGVQALPAHICKNCKLIVADYSGKD